MTGKTNSRASDEAVLEAASTASLPHGLENASVQIKEGMDLSCVVGNVFAKIIEFNVKLFILSLNFIQFAFPHGVIAF